MVEENRCKRCGRCCIVCADAILVSPEDASVILQYLYKIALKAQSSNSSVERAELEKEAEEIRNSIVLLPLWPDLESYSQSLTFDDWIQRGQNPALLDSVYLDELECECGNVLTDKDLDEQGGEYFCSECGRFIEEPIFTYCAWYQRETKSCKFRHIRPTICREYFCDQAK